MKSRSTFAAALLVACAATPAAALQESALASAGGPSGAGPGTSASGLPAIARAVRLDGTISIDGRLDDGAWQAAPIITDFVQGQPTEGAPPTEPTEVRVLFDDDAIYVSARMWETDPSTIHDQLVRRDERGSFDHFAISLDPNRDGLTGYRFQVAASGSQRDAFLFGDVEEDQDWNAVWDSGVQRDEQGWTVEMRIPLSQIRYEHRDGEQTWGINFERRRLESNETDYFSLQSRTVRGRVSQFGTIDGFRMTGSNRRLEFRPFAVSQVTQAPATPGDPLFTGSEFSPRVGTDMSVGIGSAFSLDGTINPDFGQVEVDPEVINLTAFETFFPEKRPFFVQDAQIFEFAGSRGGGGGGGGKAMFFSRRIGREPQGSGPADASYWNGPTKNSSLGAAKLTGRRTRGLSVGALGAVTARERGDAFYTDGDSLTSYVAQPAAAQGVVRLQQDFRGGASKIGVIGTAIERGLPDDGSFEFLPTRAFSFGVDFDHQWGGQRGRDWRLWGFYGGSLINGSEEAMTLLQRSSLHYFQRPDASYLGVDSTATSMFGSDWRLQFERQSARHWTYGIWLGQQTPGFDINDLGFITSGERLDAGFRLQYQEIEPGSWFQDYRINFWSFHNFRNSLIHDGFADGGFARSYDAGSFTLSGNVTFLNNWDASLRGSFGPQTQSDTQTRGGPLMVSPADWSISGNVTTDRRAALSVRPSFSYRDGALDSGYRVEGGVGFTFRPAASLELEVGPSYERQRNAAQYVTSSDAVPFEPTYGDRYLFGNLERNTVSMDTRLNVAFTPDLSLQLFLQPLISSGDYLSYRQLQAAESYDLHDFPEGQAVDSDSGVMCVGGETCVIGDTRYFDFTGDGIADDSTSDRDFNIRSLRGNAVFRWEYRPGSEIFLVWQHNRRESQDFGDLDFGRDFGGLFAAPSENVFIVKVSHYLSF
ncbi:MAG: DUF5916 domain-containing protein [Gemmatimonadota bacterium]|nr:DUF5916 domain-containing protein [Gemmatimonadota bacterium]